MLVETTPTHYCPGSTEAHNEAEGAGQFQIKAEVASHDKRYPQAPLINLRVSRPSFKSGSFSLARRL